MTAPDDAGHLPTAEHRSFSALRHPGVAIFLLGGALAMMADNIEHVVSYWVAFQKFRSPALGGFAVIAHWLPYLLFSIRIGSAADRHDPRRFIFISMLLFIGISIAWGVLIGTGRLQMWHAAVLLLLHGIAGALWTPASMLLLHELVPGRDLQSAVRLSATGRTLGVLLGPAVGSAMMLLFGPAPAVMLNVLFYVPFLVWASPLRKRYAPRLAATSGRSGFADAFATLRSMRQLRTIFYMTMFIAAVSIFIGNSYQAQMPAFAQTLGHGDPGLTYSMLLGADAAGALVAGVTLESLGLLRPHPVTALVLGVLWCCALAGFALTQVYGMALALLFVAGFVELAFTSMSQSLVQLNAPAALRGRIVGVYTLAAMGLRLFSGITVGIFGSVVGVHWALALCAAVLVMLMGSLLTAYLRTSR